MYSGRVVGLLKDFNFRTLFDRVQPVIFKIDPNRFNHIFIRIDGDNIPDSIDFIKKTFKNLVPAHPVQFSFLDEILEDAYQSERTFGIILNYATFLSILVACLGLFGLTSLTTRQRTKEIGIRKVLGATIGKIVLLLTKDYIKLIIISNVVACPIGYYFMSNWLQSFVYRTSFGLETFIITGLLTIVIAVLTVSLQAIKAAVSNPADALQYE
jgi:putative ABC transport system permease protein